MCFLLRLSTLVLSCVMILCCTGLFGGTSHRLRVRTGSVAALCPLLAAAGTMVVMPFPWLRVNLGVLLLLFVSILLCRDGIALSVSLLLAACMGACGFVLVRTFPNFYEPGLLIALPTAVAAAILLHNSRAALIGVVAAPLFYALYVLMEGYYLFHTALLDFAATEVFDAATVGAMLLFFFWWLKVLPFVRGSRHTMGHMAGER